MNRRAIRNDAIGWLSGLKLSLRVNPHLSNVDEVSSVEIAIPLEGEPEEYEWDLSVPEDEIALELVI